METAFFACPASWRGLLPEGTAAPGGPSSLSGGQWALLALTPMGAPALRRTVRCRLLLAPGDCAALKSVRAERVVTYGLSPRDSLTLSSLSEPVLCVQRTLPRPDGTAIEPQEFPLPPLPGPADALLPLLGLRLLQMPLTEGRFP